MSQCASDCLSEAAGANGCDVNDAGCVCTKQDLLTAAINCSVKGCSAEDTENMASAIQTECVGLVASAHASPSVPRADTTSSTFATSSSSPGSRAETRSSSPSTTQAMGTSSTVSPSDPTIPSESTPASSTTPPQSAPNPTNTTASTVGPAIPTVTLVPTSNPPTSTSALPALAAARSRLSTGAVVGIAVGASAATAICLALVSAALLYSKRRMLIASRGPGAGNSNARPSLRLGTSSSSSESNAWRDGGYGSAIGIGTGTGTGMAADEVLTLQTRTAGTSLVARVSYVASSVPDYEPSTPPPSHWHTHTQRERTDGSAIDEKAFRELLGDRDGHGVARPPGDPGPRPRPNGADIAAVDVGASVFSNDNNSHRAGHRRDPLQERDGGVKLAGGRGVGDGILDADAGDVLPPPYSSHSREP